jgi:hypothetical protein
MAWLVVDGLGPGLHRLVVATRGRGLDQVVIGEVGRAPRAALGLADLVVEFPHRSSRASLAPIAVAFGFPAWTNRRRASA